MTFGETQLAVEATEEKTGDTMMAKSVHNK
jgi:hypothetical protein